MSRARRVAENIPRAKEINGAPEEGSPLMMTIHHPLHLWDRVATLAMRVMAKSSKGSTTGPEARGQFDEMVEKTPAAEGV